MSFTEERLRSLTRKQAVLGTSLESWLEQTAGAATRTDVAFDIHYTQTREVDRLVKGIDTALTAARTRAVTQDTVLAAARGLEDAILGGCQIWEFFRGKLSQRLEPSLRGFLRVGDELAWQCYEPARRAALGDSPLCKAPPLVYLSSNWSPFIVTRARALEVGSLPLPLTRQASFAEALARMPFAVIALPWYQTTWLPDAVSVCHEVGHSAEVDFGLTPQIQSAIAGAVSDDAARQAWTARGSELFADLYGCLCIGPSYAWALANILIGNAADMTMLTDRSYPSHHGRMLFCAAVLGHMGFADEADAFRSAWEQACAIDGGDARLSAERTAVEAIASAMTGDATDVTRPGIAIKGTSLRTVLGFARRHQDSVVAETARLVAGGAASSSNIRVLFAAAVQACRDARFTEARQKTLLDAMRRACVDTRRNTQAQLPTGVAQAREAHLAAVGSALADELLGGV